MPPKSKVPEKKTLEQVLAARRKAGTKIGVLADFDLKPNVLTTGNISIDAITGVGGLPRGRVIELYGLPSSGKTTTALQAAGRHQQNLLEGKAKGAIAYFDHEGSLDEAYCKALGVDINDPSFIYVTPRSFEESANTFWELALTDELGMAIWDSVAVMVTEKELASETGSATVADRAKMMAQFLRQRVGLIRDKDIAAIFLNHVYEKLDMSPMGQQMKARGIIQEDTPGGRALKFHASLRIKYKSIGNVRVPTFDPLTNEKLASVEITKVQATVVKNKVAPPFKTAEVRVRFGKGFSQAFSVKEILTAYKVIPENSGNFKLLTPEVAPAGWDFDKTNNIKGEEHFLQMLESDPEWLGRLLPIAEGLLDQHGAFQLSDEEIAEVMEEDPEADIDE